jgi:cytochrome c553
MTSRSLVRSVVLLVVGGLIGAVIIQWYPIAAQAPAPSAANQAPPADLKTLAADVERLKALVPSNSHIMMDVQWFWTNLWFAGQAKNWPLAQFYFNETRGHIQWLIKKSPTMRSAGPDKEEVNIEGIFEGIDTSSLADVKTAIEKKDSALFAANYKTMLESCYSCHKSVGRPYLRPMIPKASMQAILNMDPNATWPQ